MCLILWWWVPGGLVLSHSTSSTRTKKVQFHLFKWFVSDILEHPPRTRGVIWAHMASHLLSVFMWLNSVLIPCRIFWTASPQFYLLVHASRTLWKQEIFRIWYFIYAFWWDTSHLCIPIYDLFLFACNSRPKLKLSYISLGEHTLWRINIDTVVLLRGGVQKTNPETLKELKPTIGKGCYNILWLPAQNSGQCWSYNA